METADALVHERPVPLEDRRHRAGGRGRIEGCADFSAISAQTCDWSDLCAPLLTGIDAVTCAIRFARPVAYCARGAAANTFRARPPPAGLDARHRDGQRRARRHQNGQIDDAVLFRADQLLPVDDQRGDQAAVDGPQLGDAALLGHLCNLEKPATEGTVQRLVVGDPAVTADLRRISGNITTFSNTTGAARTTDDSARAMGDRGMRLRIRGRWDRGGPSFRGPWSAVRGP